MKHDMTHAVLDLEGNPAKDFIYKTEDGQAKVIGEKTLTLKTVVIRSLNYVGPHEQIKPEDAYKRGKLIARVNSSDIVQLSAEEVSLIKRLIVEAGYPPYTVVQCHDWLEKSC